MKRSLFLAVLAAGFVLGALSVRSVPRPPEFCAQCVMRRDVMDWRLAGKWNLLETATVSATPASELFAAHGCPPHTHQWSAPQCVAEADLETSDAPRLRTVGLLNAPRTLSFLRGVFDYAGPADIACWRDVALQPVYASALEPALRFRRFPESGFATRDEFLAWWSQSAYPLFNRLHQVTQAD